MFEEPSLQSLQSDSTLLPTQKKLSFLHILGIASSKLAPNILFMILPTFFQPLSTKLHISQIWKTVLLFISSFMSFIVSPLVGVYSDSCMFKWGRRRIFIVVSLFLTIIGLLLMTYCSEIGEFLNPGNSRLLGQIVFGFSYEFVFIAGNLLDSPARAICTDIAPTSQQNLISNVCSVYGALGGIIVSIIGGLGLEKYFHIQQIQFVLITSTVFCTVSIMITVIVAHEKPLNTKPPKVRPFRQIFDSFKGMPKPIARAIPSFFVIAITYFQFAIQFSHFIARDVFHGDNTSTDQEKIDLYDKGVAFAMICGSVRYGSQFIYGFLCTKISEWIGYRWTTFFGYTCMTVSLFLFLFVNNRYAYLGISVLVGIGFHTATTLPFTITSICTSVLKLDFGAYYGIFMMFSVLGEQISNIGIGNGLGIIWPDDPRMLIVISSGFGVVSMILSLWIIEPPTENHGFHSSTDISGYKEIN